MLPLTLGVNPSGWPLFYERRCHPEFLVTAERIWRRDKKQCQYCGVVLQDGQEVINRDGAYHNNHVDNLVTACMFCVQCHFLESIGQGRYGGGTLIYFPEMTQAEVNGLCHVLFQANTSQEKESAERLYRSLSMRANLVEKYLGNGMSDSLTFGQLMVESDLPMTEDTFIANLRLLPIRGAFREERVTHDKTTGNSETFDP